jgi:hypothetical protein
MKNILFTIGFLALGPVMVAAQADNDDIAIIQAVFGKTKRVIIQECIRMKGSEHDAFWKLYDRYELDRRQIVLERFDLIRQYASRYESLDDRTASQLANAFLKNTRQTNKLNRTYIRKFENVVGGLNAALFFQVETYLSTAMQAELQSQIPLIGDLHKLSDR